MSQTLGDSRFKIANRWKLQHFNFLFKEEMAGLGNASKLFATLEHSKLYLQARFDYPEELYNRIFKFFDDTDSPSSPRIHALDVACGNGQAAVELSNTFAKVTACDASASQLAAAVQRPNITYYQSPAEDLSSLITDESIDLATAAQALHWFDLERFYKEMHRVLKPGHGTLATWGYGVLSFSAGGEKTPAGEPLLDTKTAELATQSLKQLHSGVLGAYWDERRVIVDQHYAGLEIPAKKYFKVVERQEFPVHRVVTVAQMMNYFKSWSSYQSFMRNQENGFDPIDEFQAQLQKIAGCEQDSNFIDYTVAIISPHFMILANDKL